MEEHAAEYRYYSQLLSPGNKNADSEKVDLNEWACLLGTENLFAPGGRYGIIREHFEEHPKAKALLEIGCGSGVCVAWMQKFAERCFGADIFLAPHLQQERLDTCSFLQVNANDTFPMADGSYDVVVAMMIMEHVFDPFHFCQE
jgi:2-polyprenyl-3-methyl-5-hydroxy-6-metoxy-1,4-benzoquinol methylase